MLRQHDAGRTLHAESALRLLRGIAALLALVAIGQWLFLAGERVAVPFPLEWQEGAVSEHAFRILAGQPIYPPPSGDFVPSIYPPGGYFVQAAAMKLLGAGLPAARVASAIASLLTAGVLALAVRRATGRGVPALLAAALYLGGRAIPGTWYDLARCDALFVLLVIVPVAVLDGWPAAATAGRPRTSAVVIAALASALAVLTKVQGIAIVMACFAHLWFRSRRHAMLFAALAAVLVLVPALHYERASEGWFARYTWTFLLDHPRYPERLPAALLTVLGAAPAALLLAVAFVLALRTRAPRSSRLRALGAPGGAWALAFVAFLAVAPLSMIKAGGGPNHVMPVVAFAAGLSGFVIGVADAAPRSARVRALVLVLAFGQLAWWLLSPVQRPRRDVIAAQAAVVDSLAAIPGDVLVLEDAYYGRLSGHRPNADAAALRALGYSGIDLPADLAVRLAAHDYTAVVLSWPLARPSGRSSSSRRLEQLVADHYAYDREIVRVPADEEAGALRIPRYLYVPRPGDTAVRPGNSLSR